jgi:predicted acyltransferase
MSKEPITAPTAGETVAAKAGDTLAAKTRETLAAKSTRLMSLDALRGFDMFWIVGAEELVAGLRKVSDSRLVQGVADQLEHVKWEGFHFEDLIFPMFVFIAGVSLVFSLSRTIEQEGRSRAVWHILRRAVLLYLLGVFSYGGFAGTFEHIRLLGVLQRIALAYLFAGLIFCFFDWRGRLAWCLVFLIGYWALLEYVPAPVDAPQDATKNEVADKPTKVSTSDEDVPEKFAEGRNLTNWIDKHYLPLRKWDGDHDPEGLLSTIPAIANCLIGVFAGMLLRDSTRDNRTKVAYLAIAGAAMAAAGWLWSLDFPVIKKIWTSSFVLVACGYSCLLLAAFHLVIEVFGWRKWAMPFVWIGANSITIYMIHNLVDIPKIAHRFIGGELSKDVFGRYGDLATALVGIAITLAICGFLYRRKIFLRL